MFSGRYRFDDMPALREIALHTEDELVARDRLHKFIVRAQRIAEGLAAPEPMRAAMASSLTDLIGQYAIDLHAQGCVGQHVSDTTRRVQAIATGCRWTRLGDVNAADFTKWRGRKAPTISAKYLKEYQVSLNAFFTWLTETERYDRNPIAKVRLPQTRGRETLIRRALTPDEARRLVSVADYHRVPYLVLLYTGLRYREAWGLRWCDFIQDAAGARFVIPASRTKNRREAVIPVRPELAAEVTALRTHRAEKFPTRRIFIGMFPSRKTTVARPNALRRDMALAGVEVKDARGHVVDYHSFRKTWATWAAASGVPQRSAQAILRHSTPDLTANVYTDVQGLGLCQAVTLLPWVGETSKTPQKSQLLDSLEAEKPEISLPEVTPVQSFANGGRHRTRTCDPIRVKDVL